MKVQFILNPCSGRNRRRPWLASVIRDFARARLGEATLVTTESRGHATELARRAVASGSELVVAVGGDGTMNEVAQALVQSPAALALIPCGSGNGLALHLGLPRSLERALTLLTAAHHKVVAIDTGLVDDRPFFNAMGLGFDAEVSRRFNSLTRRGLPAYMRETAAALRGIRSERCTLVAGDRRTVLDTVLVAVANSDQYGNNARIAPGAQVDDGLLDLVAVRPAPLWSLAALVPSLFLGTFDQSRHVCRLRGASFQIHREHAGLVHTDGETHALGAVINVRVNPRSLRVLVPQACPVAASPAPYTSGNFVLQLP